MYPFGFPDHILFSSSTISFTRCHYASEFQSRNETELRWIPSGSRKLIYPCIMGGYKKAFQDITVMNVLNTSLLKLRHPMPLQINSPKVILSSVLSISPHPYTIRVTFPDLECIISLRIERRGTPSLRPALVSSIFQNDQVLRDRYRVDATIVLLSTWLDFASGPP